MPILIKLYSTTHTFSESSAVLPFEIMIQDEEIMANKMINVDRCQWSHYWSGSKSLNTNLFDKKSEKFMKMKLYSMHIIIQHLSKLIAVLPFEMIVSENLNERIFVKISNCF